LITFAGCNGDSGNDATALSNLNIGVMSSGLTGASEPGIAGLAHAYVTIDEVTAHTAGGWVTVKKGIGVKVDILALSASAVDLGFASLPAGRITQIRLMVDPTHAPYVVTKSGAKFPLKVPSGEQSGIKIIGDWNIGGCDTMAMMFDLDGKRSIWIHPNGNGLYILRPVIHLFQAHGRMAGCEAHGCQAAMPTQTQGSAMALSSTSATQGHKTTICHIPPGNPGNAHTITVGNPAVPAHLAHGDYIGACLAHGEMCTGPGGGNNPGGSNGNGNGNPNNPGHGGTPPGWTNNPNNPHHVPPGTMPPSGPSGPGGTNVPPPLMCNQTPDCPSNLACNSGTCGPIPPGGMGGSQPPLPCTSSTDCPSNLMCDQASSTTLQSATLGTCTAGPSGVPPIPCAQTTDCPSNLACDAGTCGAIPPGGTGGTQPTLPCTSALDCPTNLMCDQMTTLQSFTLMGTCTAPPNGTPPIPCTLTADCPMNLMCSVAGICAPGGTGGTLPPMSCTTVADCPTNLDCAGGVCGGPISLPPLHCAQTADCPANLACTDGLCGSIPPGGSGGSQPPLPCTVSTECPANLGCSSGVCGGPHLPPLHCAQTADCPTNLACTNGICGAIPPGGSGGSQPPIGCMMDADCPENLNCSGLSCAGGNTSGPGTTPPGSTTPGSTPPTGSTQPGSTQPGSTPPVNGTTPDGSPCTQQSDCALGSFCNSATGLCATLSF
jgi:hypothetical protein